MSKAARKTASIAELLRGAPIAWAKNENHFDIMKYIDANDAVVVFEDDHVVAYEIDEAHHDSPLGFDERRITVAPKRSIESFLDIGIADGQLSNHLLFGVQQVAYKLGFHKTGFEVRFDVLPPYQRRPHFSLTIRTGHPKRTRSVS